MLNHISSLEEKPITNRKIKNIKWEICSYDYLKHLNMDQLNNSRYRDVKRRSKCCGTGE